MSEIKICPECETEYDEETCPECDCSNRFSELERLSLELEDKLGERLSELNHAKQNIQSYEDAVTDARNKLYQNDDELRNFKWWTRPVGE